MNAYGAKIGRIVSYKTAAGKLRSCRVTAVTSGTVATLRDADRTTTYATKTRRGTTANPTQNDKWHP